MLRFTTRDLLWLTVVVGLAIALLLEHRRAEEKSRLHGLISDLLHQHLKVHRAMQEIIKSDIVMPEDGSPPPTRWEPVWDKPAVSP